jgi:bleomycin hydrolase
MKFKIFLFLLLSSFIFSQVPQKDKAVYKEKYKDPVLKEMEDANDKSKEEEEKKTKEIQDKIKEEKKKEKEEKKVLKVDFSNIKKPENLDVFQKVFHFPPVAQYLTGTCWAFSTISFLESEIFRLTGKKVKLSEIFVVYYEYIEKAKGFIETRGDTYLGEGSEANAVFRVISKYGIVPLSVYTGLKEGKDKHDHSFFFERFENFLNFIKEKNYWKEEEVIPQITNLLNYYFGKPPESFEYEGKTYTPKTFLYEYLQINPDDYVSVMSTMSQDFYTTSEFKVPDNWWHSKDYYNLPLEEFYSIIKEGIKNGFSIAIGGDVSEPGYEGFEDCAIVPTFDIPEEYIDQSARELRIYNNTTEDDHGVHLVGYAEIDGKDWFLIKDSARSSRWGKFEGYYFYRGDYVKLKMLTITVHKDLLKPYLGKFKK